MERIASFCVDHTKLLPGMYLSRQDGENGEILTWDIRMKQPNKGSYLSPAAAHTLEQCLHIGGGFIVHLLRKIYLSTEQTGCVELGIHAKCLVEHGYGCGVVALATAGTGVQEACHGVGVVDFQSLPAHIEHCGIVLKHIGDVGHAQQYGGVVGARRRHERELAVGSREVAKLQKSLRQIVAALQIVTQSECVVEAFGSIFRLPHA